MQKLMPARFMPICAVLILALSACDAAAVIPPAVTLPAESLPTQPETATPFQPDPSDGLTELPMQVGYGVKGSFFELYFTDPFNRAATKQEGGPDVLLAQSIDQARVSVDM